MSSLNHWDGAKSPPNKYWQIQSSVSRDNIAILPIIINSIWILPNVRWVSLMCTRSCFNENILHTTSNSSNLFSFMSKFQFLHKFPKTPWEALDVWFKSLRWSKILFDPTKHCQIYEANSNGGLVVVKSTGNLLWK